MNDNLLDDLDINITNELEFKTLIHSDIFIIRNVNKTKNSCTIHSNENGYWADWTLHNVKRNFQNNSWKVYNGIKKNNKMNDIDRILEEGEQKEKQEKQQAKFNPPLKKEVVKDNKYDENKYSLKKTAEIYFNKLDRQMIFGIKGNKVIPTKITMSKNFKNLLITKRYKKVLPK